MNRGFGACFVPDPEDDAWAGCTSAFAHERVAPRKTNNKSLDRQLIKGLLRVLAPIRVPQLASAKTRKDDAPAIAERQEGGATTSVEEGIFAMRHAVAIQKRQAESTERLVD